MLKKRMLETRKQSLELLLKRMRTETSVSMTWSRDQGNPTGQRGQQQPVSDQRKRRMNWNSVVSESTKEWPSSSWDEDDGDGDGDERASHPQTNGLKRTLLLMCCLLSDRGHGFVVNEVKEVTVKEKKRMISKEDSLY
jgi:hypothetical protein